MVSIRPMTDGDASSVAQVDAVTFADWAARSTGKAEAIQTRRIDDILANWAKDPQGCFVAASEAGQVVGFIFSRTWGTTGWFGTFAVLPEYQGADIGQNLIKASLGYLRQRGCKTIGLETMPQTIYNLGLYLKLGFRPVFLTLLLTKDLQPQQVPTRHGRIKAWSQEPEHTRNQVLAEFKAITNSIELGLDYGKEAIVIDKFGFGDTLIWHEGAQALGFAAINLRGPRPGSEELGIIEALAMSPAHCSEADALAFLIGIENYVLGQGKAQLVVPINTIYLRMLTLLVEHGYRVFKSRARMILGELPDPRRARDIVNLSSWAA